MSFGVAVIVILLAVIGGFAGAAISERFYRSWGIPRDHWTPWYVSIASFGLLSFTSTYLSGSSTDWRHEEIDRLVGWINGGAILAGHLIAYLIVKARVAHSVSDSDR